ncbi:hypothetical protein [Pyxidicoccus caerfyrddinensis]|uniref:hypothetical protein n=1 Tax=Pyxidicoccus caerfyrddinensis TaxID=2709663 RepID=UPI0019684A20|nr:hypothetical protein [Pyxidicoccus caerfyrddinensis]
MRERPLLFLAPMVLAILAGRKTVTRRVLTASFPPVGKRVPGPAYERASMTNDAALLKGDNVEPLTVVCPYGQPGDRLWVKETWRPAASSLGQRIGWRITYAADGAVLFSDLARVDAAWRCPAAAKRGNVTPLFMPRWASRLTLEVVSVRVERLHDITEEDARAEGVERHPTENGWRNYEPEPHFEGVAYHTTARESFASLWRFLNGAESWDASPWVWRVEFKRVEVAR